MRPNRLRELLNAGQPSVGTAMMSPWPGTVEILGRSGVLDYVEFVAEYAPYDLFTLENLGRAVDLFDDFSAMIKVEQEPRGFIASRAIGAGIQNVLFADVRTPEDAAECVAAVRPETPEGGGQYGATSRRFAGYSVRVDEREYVQALEDSVIAFMIEKATAIENLENLLGTKGLDMVVFGPADYSMSIGIAGEWTDPKVLELELEVYRRALELGVQPRAEIGTPDDAKRYLDIGVRHFSLSTDTAVIYRWYQENVEAVRKAIDGA